MGKESKITGLEAVRQKDARWYLADDKHVANKLTTVAKAIRKNDQARKANFERYASLYSNLPILGLTPRRYTQQQVNISRDKLALNVIKSCSDSFVAKLTNEKPRISCVTTGGSWDMQRRAHMLETFLDGQFYETDFYETAPLVALDMAVFGTGTVKIYSDGEGEDERICLERVMPLDTFVDDAEAFSGPKYVRSRYQEKYIDRLVAMAAFADGDDELAEKLATAPRDETDPQAQAGVTDNTYTDTIRIVEGWHLPSRAGAEDGRHTIACGDILIFDEKWDKPYFPFVDLYRQKPQAGVWGIGLAEELQGIQFELNWIANAIRRATRMSGTLRWWVENGSNVNTQYISDIIGSVGRYSGTPPIAMTPPIAAPELYEREKWLQSEAYSLSGVGELSATSSAPANEESGKAKEIRLDTESERFSPAFTEYHLFFYKVARQIIALSREIGERNASFKVKAVDRGQMMKVISWADIHLEEDEYFLQMVPTNALARDPSRRVQQLIDRVNAGLMTQQQAQRLDNSFIPDLQAEDDYTNASFNLTMRMITNIVEDGHYDPPEVFMDLGHNENGQFVAGESVRRFQMARIKARMDDVPEDRCELLERWMVQARDLVMNPPQDPTAQLGNELNKPPPPPPAPPGAQPPPGAAPPGGAPPMPQAA